MSLTDQASQIREGEELDAVRVDAYLKGQLQDLQGPLTISQFPGGASNLTYLLQYPDRAWCCAARRSGARPSPPTTWAASSAFSIASTTASPIAPRPCCTARTKR